MQRLEVSGAVQLIYRSLGVKGLMLQHTLKLTVKIKGAPPSQNVFHFLFVSKYFDRNVSTPTNTQRTGFELRTTTFVGFQINYPLSSTAKYHVFCPILN